MASMEPMMGYTRTGAIADPEILWNSEYVGAAMTIVVEDVAVSAGTPINEDGEVANDSSAIGILLHTVFADRPQGTVVIGGYINTAVAEGFSKMTISADAKGAMKNVVFMNASSRPK